MRTIVVTILLTLGAIVSLRLVDRMFGEPTSRAEMIAMIAGGIVLALYFRAKESKRGDE